VATIARSTELLQSELNAVERILHRSAASDVEALEAAARHILNAGGKRLRPQMLILAARAAGGSTERAVPLAAAAELVHTATLVHDDIVDEADRRRGRAAVQFYFGNSASVLTGDFLVIRAFRIVAEDGDPRILRILVDTIGRMCEGEVLEISIKGDLDLSVEVYETIIACKTAVLMATCGEFGAHLGNANPDVVDALSQYGYNVGMAFQIVDDILDFTGDEGTLGKPVGGDLREGKVTLPVILALQTATPPARAELAHLFEKRGPLTVDDIQRAREIIRDTGGFARARQCALRYIDHAQAELARIPGSAAGDALCELAASILDRRC
jgi:octaprenyl-diphosphate synthase